MISLHVEKNKNIVLSVLSLLLVGAIVVILYGNNRVPVRTFHGKLTDLLPPAPIGWLINKREIANTPEMREAVGAILNYDDGLFVDYVQGDVRLSVYIAYWKPGKMSYRIVASHTPDVCWVANGWRKEFSKTVSGLKTIDGKNIASAEGRLFTAQGNPEYVWFWHVVGEDVQSYDTGFMPPWYAPAADIFKRGLNQRDEQFFIRLSSSVPLDSLALKPVMEPLLALLPLPKSKSIETKQ